MYFNGFTNGFKDELLIENSIHGILGKMKLRQVLLSSLGKTVLPLYIAQKIQISREDFLTPK